MIPETQGCDARIDFYTWYFLLKELIDVKRKGFVM